MKSAVSLTDRGRLKCRGVYSYCRLTDLMSWSQKLDVQKLTSQRKGALGDRRRARRPVFLLAAIMVEYYYVGSVQTGGGRRGIPRSGVEKVTTHR